MRLPLWSKVCLLLVLAVCTSVITSSIIGQTRPRQKRTAARPVAQKRGRPAPRFAEYHLNNMDVTSNGNGIVVKADATIFDLRTNVSLVWKLAALDENTKKVIAERIYKDQMFEYANGANSHPIFADTMNLTRGNYRIMLTLYEVPKNRGFNLDLLRGAKAARGQRVLVGVKTLSVP